jgi:hypothetical protein
MDPNSQHQEWSEWKFRVVAAEHPPFRVALDHLRRATLAEFGSHGRMRARVTQAFFEVEIQAETSGRSVLDPAWCRHVQLELLKAVRAIWLKGFQSLVWFPPRLLAGNPENGQPRSQWIDIPALPVGTTLQGKPLAQELGMPAIGSTARVWGQ